MANDAYRTKVDVSIPRPIAKLSGEGDDEVWATEGVNYPAGSHVLASDLEPHVRRRAEAGELSHLLEPASLEDAQNAPAGDPVHGVFVAEHEAEAHILQQYGHTVVPPEQELEAMSAGADRARHYQDAVKEHGLDHRPVQEALAQQRQRVPDEALEGHETRTGMPTNREPYLQGAESDDSESEPGGAETESESGAPRPRPGA